MFTRPRPSSARRRAFVRAAFALASFAPAATEAATPTPGAPPPATTAPTPAPTAPAPTAPPTTSAPKNASKSVATPSATPPADLRFDVKRERLDNGLRVVMLVDHATPTVAVDVVYDVGSRNEVRGRSGFAHLFEHMMFQGSKNVPRGEHFKLVTSHGGTLNGTTSEDRTNYFEMLPSSELALGLWLEADRMKSLDVSQSNFENQRAVVKEEYRMRVENAAYVPAMLRLQELVFQGYWPYEHSPIGTMQDLDAAQLDWVRAFHDAYYAPNNAVLSIAGDFDPNDAMTLVRKYFGDARAKSEVPPFDAAQAIPPQTAERKATVEDPHAKLAALFEGWVIPKSGEPDHYALALAAMLLGDGESSRLHRALVREQNLAVEIGASVSSLRGPDMFEVDVKLAGGASLDKVKKLVETQIGDLGRLGPSDADMTKLRNRIRARFLFGLQSNFARAQKLAEMEVYRGDARLLNEELGRYYAVTKADIQRVVATYLTPSKRSTVEVVPTTPAGTTKAATNANTTKTATPAGTTKADAAKAAPPADATKAAANAAQGGKK